MLLFSSKGDEAGEEYELKSTEGPSEPHDARVPLRAGAALQQAREIRVGDTVVVRPVGNKHQCADQDAQG